LAVTLFSFFFRCPFPISHFSFSIFTLLLSQLSLSPFSLFSFLLLIVSVLRRSASLESVVVCKRIGRDPRRL
jgi:hypothetical protein